MFKTIRILIQVAIFLFLSNIAVSQEQYGNLSGSVTEEKSGESIVSLTLSLYLNDDFANNRPIRGSYTNRFGFYSIPRIEAGEYFLVASGVGYSTFVTKIKINESENLRLNIQMKTEDVRTQGVTVEAERIIENATTRISTVTIDPSFISKLPSLGGEVDLFRALQLLPGVQQSTELSSGLYVRGGSPDQNLNLLDGVIVYNPIHLGGFLSVFNTDALRDVKLIKGAFPAEYGGRLSSVLDMTMKEGTKEKLSGSAGISLLSSRLTLEGPINENSSFMISGRRMYLDLLANLATILAGEDPKQNPTYYFYDLNAKANYKLSDNNHLFVSGFLCQDVLGAPDDSDDAFDISWGNRTSNIRWMHIVSPMLFTNFSLIYTDYTFGTDIYDKNKKSNNFKTDSRIRDIMLRADAQYFPSKKHKVKTGLETIWHNFRSRAAINLDDEDLFDTFFSRKDITSLEASYYIQDEWTITERLDANIGGRFYYFQEADYFSFEPRLSASYKLTEVTSLKTSAALAHQFLHLITRNDITLPTDLWFPSTKNIRTSRAWQGVFGLEHIFDGGNYIFSAEVYYKDMRNLYEYKDSVFFTLGIPLEEQFTRGRGDAYGLELFLNKRLGSFTGWIGYTLAWTNRYFDELNNGKRFSPRYDRRHDINLVLAYNFNDTWEVGLSWVYGTGQAYTMPTGTYSFQDIDTWNWYYEGYSKYQFTSRNGARLPSFHKLDLNFMNHFTMLGMPTTFSINIYNVYNRRNPFAWYISEDWDMETGKEIKKLKQVTLFPIIPTLGLSFKF